MTRACNSTRPRSPKSATATGKNLPFAINFLGLLKNYTACKMMLYLIFITGAQPFRMSKDRGVTKKTVNQPRLKAISKSHSKDECLALLKNLLPSSNQEQPVSEVQNQLQCLIKLATLGIAKVLCVCVLVDTKLAV